MIFHTVSGNIYRLAEAMAEGIRDAGCEAKLLRIPEPAGLAPITMPGLEARHHEFSHVPEARIEDLIDCEGLALGTPVYWGNMSYATSYFLNSAAQLWRLPAPDRPVNAPKLQGKPATVFTGGGTGLANDPAILGLWTTLAIFGMTIVTLGIGVPEISSATRGDGGSPLGAGTFTRRPGAHPTEIEKTIANKQGRFLAEAASALASRAKV